MLTTQNLIQEHIDNWENEAVNIAVTGGSCVGKSFFINTIRSLEPEDDGAASVGMGDTTESLRFYTQPEKPCIKYWDLPGVGTPQFPMQNSYFQLIKVDKYDLFLIFFCTTITEADLWLARNLKLRNKPIFFFRTKIDEIRCIYRKRPSVVSAKIEESKGKYMQTLYTNGIDVDKLYAISSIELDLGDFNELIADMCGALVDTKKKNLLLSMKIFTKDIVEQKRRVLLNNTWKAATLVAISTGMPIPGLDVMVNIGVLSSQVESYLRVFELDTRSLSKLQPHILAKLNTCTKIKSMGTDGFLHWSIMKSAAYSLAAENTIEMLLPVLGSIITGTAALVFSNRYLKNIINDLAEDAKIVKKCQLESCIH